MDKLRTSQVSEGSGWLNAGTAIKVRIMMMKYWMIIREFWSKLSTDDRQLTVDCGLRTMNQIR